MAAPEQVRRVTMGRRPVHGDAGIGGFCQFEVSLRAPLSCLALGENISESRITAVYDRYELSARERVTLTAKGDADHIQELSLSII